MADEYNERAADLEALQSCFPDECFLTSENSGYVELPATLETPLQLILARSADTQMTEDEVQSHTVSHLPAVRITFALADDYPAAEAPQINLQATPSWLPDTTIQEVEEIAKSLWEGYGRTAILFAYVSDVDSRIKTAFGLSNLQVTSEVLTQLLDFDRKAKKMQFDKGTYDCGVCLDPKKGSACHRMDACGHVFCIQCLEDCYNNAILTGSIEDVKCPAYNCGSENDTAQARRAKKVRLITPRELLQIPIERPAVQRYVDVKRKKKLEADKTTVWCPRKWCHGAARGSNYPKLAIPLDEMDQVYESAPANSPLPNPDAATEVEDDEFEKDRKLLADRLRVCEDCSFAFCKLCTLGWHGDFEDCRPRSENAHERKKLSKEDEASEEFILLHTSPCPKCEARTQKTDACNHMRCTQCSTHFCYLCSQWLEPQNPHKHFNTPGTECYQRLWVLEGGDNGDLQANFGGARGAEMAARQIVTAETQEEERRRVEEMAEIAGGE